MNRWYVIQTKSNQELTAVENLKSQNFIVFFPTCILSTVDKKTGGVKRKIVPLFPSYMFIQFDATIDTRWKTINSTRGVSKLIGCTEEFLSPLPEGCIDEIMSRIDVSGHIPLDVVIEQIKDFKEGMNVQINSGKFKGFHATYCNHSKNLVTLFITLLNHKIKLILPLDAVNTAF